MSTLCATHPDVPSTGQCSACGRPYCGACVVEDISMEATFCSTSCRESQQGTPESSGRPNAELIEGLATPIRTGWQLCSNLIWPLIQWVGVPVGVAYSFFDYAVGVFAVPDPESGLSLVGDVGVVVAFVVAAPAAAVLLSRGHASGERENPWPQVGARLVPFILTWILFGAATMAGTVLFIVPGIILGIRLFWADEFALVHGHDPVSAVRESLNLTRGLGGRIFAFQFGLGFAVYLVLIPMFAGISAIGWMLDAQLFGPVSSLVSNVLLSSLFVITYASAHAPEVVYFYGLRALRAELPADQIRGDWVTRGLRDFEAGAAPSSQRTCPSCGTPWNPAEYRVEAEAIFCSTCRTELSRPW